MPMRALIVVLALSPIPFLLCLVGFGFAFDTVLGSLAGEVAIFVPLAFLAFSKNAAISQSCRRWLRWALGSSFLVLPAVALHLAPNLSMKSGQAGQIRLDPPPHQMPAEGAAFLRGLSVKDGVMILKSQPDEDNNSSSPFTACDYLEWFSPPSHFYDENGNGLDFRMNGKDVLHLQDDRGGFADVRWNGKQFVLLGSHSAGQADSAKSPGAAAALGGKFGDLLLILAPMLAWLLVTRFARQHFQESAEPAPSLVPATVLQIAGMIVLVFAVLSAPAAPDEVAGGLLIAILLFASACSIAGLCILAWKLLCIRVEGAHAI
jgi:hypothetical protein